MLVIPIAESSGHGDDHAEDRHRCRGRLRKACRSKALATANAHEYKRIRKEKLEEGRVPIHAALRAMPKKNRRDRARFYYVCRRVAIFRSVTRHLFPGSNLTLEMHSRQRRPLAAGRVSTLSCDRIEVPQFKRPRGSKRRRRVQGLCAAGA